MPYNYALHKQVCLCSISHCHLIISFSSCYLFSFLRLLGWIWWMMKANLKDDQQNTCPRLFNGLMYLIRHIHTMCITVTQICTP